MAKNELAEVEVDDEVSILDDANPRSIINLVPEKVRSAILDLHKNNPEMASFSEQQFLKEYVTSESMDNLRLSFWTEYNRAQDTGQLMKAKNIYSPVMCAEMFYSKFIHNQKNVAWMLIPPANYMLSLKAYLEHGKKSLRKIMTANLIDDNGNLKVEDTKLFLKAYQLIDNRVHGSAIQRIEQKTATIHMSPVTGDPKDLKRELEELRASQPVIEIESGDGR